MPSIVQLEYIVALDTYRHFGQAAEKCFVTQPTLSMQIRKAEEELGVVLFDRSRQPVLPTDIGIHIIRQARIILREVQGIQEVIHNFRNELRGQLRVGIIPTVAPYLLPYFVGDLVRDYPGIDLYIQEKTTEDITQALLNDQLDVGILATPIVEQQLKYEPIFYEEIQLYVHPNHPLFSAENITLDCLQDADIWLLSQGHCFRNQMLNLCARSHSIDRGRLPFRYESGSLEALKRLVDKEGGFTFMPELAVGEHQNFIKKINQPSPLREISLVYVRSFAKKKLLELFKSYIQNALPPYMLNMRGQVVEWQ